MKLNKSRLGLFLLIMACLLFISIGSVSAANDVNVTSFKEMNTQIQAGNDVNLVKDITGLDGLTEGITIKGKTTVNGNGHSIDAQSTGRFFKIESSSVLTLKNITLKNGYSTDGGAIYNYKGTITVTDSTFSNNKAYNDEGGAIYNKDGTLTVTHSTFKNNIASADVPPKYIHTGMGGAIYNVRGILTVIDSTFSDNIVWTSGGAIHNYKGTLTVTGSTFNNNIVKGGNAIFENGGAIFNRDGTITVTGSTFNNNKACDHGGAIHNEYGKLTVTKSTFNNNNADDHGGAIHNKEGTITVTGSTFNNNHADDNGGAIYNKEGTLTVTDSTFNNNHANDDGGAIWCSNTFTCTGSNFKGNTGNDGGAIYTDSALYVKNCIFTENKVSRAGAASADGGAIRCYNLGECKNCKFIKNTANNGGAIAIIDGTATYTVRDCIFQENKAIAMKHGVNGQGGAIFVNKMKATINLIHNQWINNYASKRGDNVYTWGYYGTIAYNYFVGPNHFREHKSFGADKKHYDPKRCYSLEEWNKHYSSNIVKPNSGNTHYNLVKTKDMVKMGTVKLVSKNTAQADNSTVNNTTVNNTTVNSDMDLFAMINSLINNIMNFISSLISDINPMPPKRG